MPAYDPYRNLAGAKLVGDLVNAVRRRHRKVDEPVAPIPGDTVPLPAPGAGPPEGVTVIRRPSMAAAAGKILGDYWRNNGWFGRIAKAALVAGAIFVTAGIAGTILGTAGTAAAWVVIGSVAVAAVNEVRLERKQMMREQLASSVHPTRVSPEVLPDTEAPVAPAPSVETPDASGPETPAAEAPAPSEPAVAETPETPAVVEAPAAAEVATPELADTNPHPIKGRNLSKEELSHVRSEIAKTRFWRIQKGEAEGHRDVLSKIADAGTPAEARALANEALKVRETDAVRCRENLAYRSALGQIATLARDAKSLARVRTFAGEVLSIYAPEVSVATTGAAPTAEHNAQVAARAAEIGSSMAARLAPVARVAASVAREAQRAARPEMHIS